MSNSIEIDDTTPMETSTISNDSLEWLMFNAYSEQFFQYLLQNDNLNLGQPGNLVESLEEQSKVLSSCLEPSDQVAIERLTDIFRVLENPYTKLVYYQAKESKFGAESFVRDYKNRLIQVCECVPHFIALPLVEQLNLLVSNLLDMLAIRTVPIYSPDRDCWTMINVSAQSNFPMCFYVQFKLKQLNLLNRKLARTGTRPP